LIPLLINVLHATETDQWLHSETRRTLKDSKKYALQALMNLAFNPENTLKFTKAMSDQTSSPKQAIHSLLADAKEGLTKLPEGSKGGRATKDLKEKIKALDSVLFILESQSKKNKKVQENVQNLKISQDSEAKHIMISYQWDSQPIVIKLAQKLKSLGHKIWLDIEQMQGSTLEAMATAVEQAFMVLICVSQKYKDSPNCRMEGEYASNLHKRVIFLKVEDYQPDGWLGIMLGAKLWYNFYRDEKFEESLASVAAVLTASSLPGQSLHLSSSSAISAAASHAPSHVYSCASWKDAEVALWLASVDLAEYAPLFKQEKITGKAIVLLVKWRKEDLTGLVAFLEKLGIPKLGDVLALVDALSELVK